VEPKLHPPHVSNRSVVRSRLVERLNRTSELPLVLVCAPAGYGKTTTLAQWVTALDQRPFAWVSLDRGDDDPIVLLSHVAVALDRISPIDPGVFEALASPGASIEAKLVPRLGAAMADLDQPAVIVLDDVHAIDNPRSLDAILALIAHLPNGAQIVLSTRDRAGIPLGRLRTRARVVEIGPADLRMEAREARALLSESDLELSDDDVTELVRHTEGWPAGLYLATLSAGTPGGETRMVSSLSGNDRFVAEFLRAEFLARLPPEHARFLVHTSVLEQLSGPLCDTVLQSHDGAAMVESLAASNMFVVSLDRDGVWYRCHHLVRELLAAELVRSEPDLVSTLLGRAVDWCAANGHETWAIRYAQEARDPERVAAIVERAVQPLYQSGRATTVQQWFDWLDAHSDPRRYPAVAVIGAMFHAAIGSPAQSDRWAAIAAHGDYDGVLPDGTESIGAWRAMLRAYRGRDGVAAIRADASLALATLAPNSVWYPVAMALLAVAEVLEGDVESADDRFAAVVEMAPHLGTPDLVPVALAERALIALGQNESARADALAEQAIWTVRHSRLEDAPLNALIFAVATRAALESGRSSVVQELVTQAQRRLPQLTYAIPTIAAQSRLELARTYVALGDWPGAGVMLREVDAILRRCPDLGLLPVQAAELRSRLGAITTQVPGASSITSAELRVLPLLPTHMSFREIGERLSISVHTVRSHAISIYRKLDVTSRADAVQRARDLGLL